MNGAKQFAEAVGCKKASVGERSALNVTFCFDILIFYKNPHKIKPKYNLPIPFHLYLFSLLQIVL